MPDEPATPTTRDTNTIRIAREMGRRAPTAQDWQTIRDLRQELRASGIKGFKRGGRVHRTGIYKLHRGERVVPARSKRRSRR